MSSLNVLYGLEAGRDLQNVLSPLAGYAFLVFNMLCSPCVAAIGAIRREMGSAKWTLFALGYQTTLAYAVTLMIYQFGRLLTGHGFGLGSLAAVLVLGISLFLLLRPAANSKK